MKNGILVFRSGMMAVITLAVGMVFSFSIVEASEDPLYLDGDYIQKNPVTGKYSSDWSHLDNKENYELFKDVQQYHEALQPEESNRVAYSLSHSVIEEDKELSRRIGDFIKTIDPSFTYPSEGKKARTSTFYSSGMDDYFESTYSKLLEAELHMLKNVLSPSELAAAFENANGARDHAKRYAANNNWYINGGTLKTWDNPADTLRHFAWNWMNSNDLGTGKARLVGDLHELALFGVKYIDEAWACVNNIACKVTYAAVQTNKAGYAAQASLATFNNYFNDPSVMDFINNSEGRKAFVKGYNNYSEPFNIGLKNGSLIQFPTWINSTYRTKAWESFK